MPTVRIGLARYRWQTAAPGAMGHLEWPDWVFDEIFRAPNGWSLHDYWLRSTFGFIDAQFDIRPGCGTLRDRAEADLMDDTWAIIDACKQQAQDDGAPLVGYDAVIAFVHAPPCRVAVLFTQGVIGGSSGALDQNAELFFYQHELGHVFGFGHSYGPLGVYNDPYCVMGGLNTSNHAFEMPPRFRDENITMLKGAGFWNSTRVLSAAALYRYVPDFANSPRVVRIDVAHASSLVKLTALSHGHGGEGRLLAVVPTDAGEFTIEYRPSFGDERASRSAVVVHSIGYRPFDVGPEVNPVWFEAAINPFPGETRVIDPERLTIEIAPNVNDQEIDLYLTQVGTIHDLSP